MATMMANLPHPEPTFNHVGASNEAFLLPLILNFLQKLQLQAVLELLNNLWGIGTE
jgi:hypothetical protein